MTSVVSVWEIPIKAGLGKLLLPIPATALVGKQMDRNRIGSLAIRPSQVAELERLPPLHREPFGRMLVALTMLKFSESLSDRPCWCCVSEINRKIALRGCKPRVPGAG
jgi:PIN domain nuclease of toxin-antitoxin system